MKNRYIELALSGLRESQGYMTKGTDQYHETEEAIQYFESELQQLEGREKAIEVAVKVIYLNDRSDYLSALYQIVIELTGQKATGEYIEEKMRMYSERDSQPF